MNPYNYLYVAGLLFTIGAIGVIVRRNAIVVFMCIELMLNAANLTLVTFSRINGTLEGQVTAFFTMVVAACEVVVGLAIIILFTVAAAAAHWIAPYDPTEQFFDGLTLEGAPLPPSSRFWFGSDTNGRDQFSRLLYGAQTSLLIGVLANGLAVAVGTLLGVTAGFLRGLTGLLSCGLPI